MSNDNTAKPTEGELYGVKMLDGWTRKTKTQIFRKDGKYAFVAEFHNDADAELTIQAFNVHHETGLTPRQLVGKLAAAEESDADSLRMYRSARDRADQLAEQRDDAIKALAGMLSIYDDDDEKVNDSRIAAARATIAKIEGYQQ